MRAGLAVLLIPALLSACMYTPPSSANGANARSGYIVSNVAAPAWRPVDAQTGQIQDLAGLQKLAASFPDSSSVHLRLLQVHFAAEDVPHMIAEAVWLAERGYLFSEGARGQIIGLAGETATADQLRALFARNAVPKTASTLFDTIPPDARLVESIAIDPASDSIYASTIASRDLFRGERGNWSRLDLDDVGSLSGLALDTDRGIVWASSAAFDPTPDPGTAFHGIIGFDLDSRQIVYRLSGEAESTPSDLHVNENGSLFASDTMSGAIYSALGVPEDLDTMIPAGTFRSPQGLTTSADGHLLYVSDYRYGIAVVDLETKSVSRLVSNGPMILDGIDGLWRVGSSLIGIQNGMSPMRIVAIELSGDGYSATKLRVLEQAHPDWTEPLGGTIYDGALYYVATGQWDRFDKGGTSVKGKPAIPTQLRRLPL